MKKMKLLLMVSVVAMFALCGCSEAEETNKDEKVEEAPTQMDITNIDDVVSVSYTDNTATITLVNEEGIWYFEGDMETWVDQAEAYEIVEEASYLTSIDVVDDAGALADYGLEAPVYTVVVKDAEGTETIIHIGNTDDDGNYYATIGESGEVYIISKQLPEILQFDKELLKVIVEEEIEEEIPEEDIPEEEIPEISEEEDTSFTEETEEEEIPEEVPEEDTSETEE